MSDEKEAASPLEQFIATSPLAEADPASLDAMIEERVGDIMNTPPLTLIARGPAALDIALKTLVKYYRDGRTRFAIESRNAPKGPKKKAPKSVAEALSADDLDL